MVKITALVHTHNDGARIGSALESLRACDEILVVDHNSADDTIERAREHGATVITGVPGVDSGVHAIDARYDWILCLLPSEAVSEVMEASLFNWKDMDERAREIPAPGSFAFPVRAETAAGWNELGAQTRLVNRKHVNWTAELPQHDAGAEVLPGHLLRFSKP